MVVTAHYQNGAQKQVPPGDLTLSVNEGEVDRLVVASTTVTVSYSDGGVTKSDTITIEVSPLKVAAPTAKTDLVYNGTEQTGVEEGEHYTLSGDTTATNAGVYSATAKLKDKANTTWEDGTTDDVLISWTIREPVTSAEVIADILAMEKVTWQNAEEFLDLEARYNALDKSEQTAEATAKLEVLRAQSGYLNPYILEERQLNVTQLDVFSRLMADRIIFLGTEINDYTANVLQAQLLYLDSVDSSMDINIYINSPGGSVTAGLGIYDTMQFVESDVATMCTGMAASMAAVLLVAGKEGKRTALTHSRVMIHQPLGGVQGQASDIEIEAREIQKFKKELYTIISEHSHTPFEKVWQDSDRNYWMTAAEAKEYGMIDAVMKRKSSADK